MQRDKRFSYQEYNSLKAELDKQVNEHQPDDLLQFCTTFFLKQLEKERAADRHHPLGIIITMIAMITYLNFKQ